MAPNKPVLHPLKTPKSMTFPSELKDKTKSEDSSATPISPPLAYTEFLKALTPIFTSPVSAGGAFPAFACSPTSTPSSATSLSFSATGSAKPSSSSFSSTSPHSSSSSSSATLSGKNLPPASPATAPKSAHSARPGPLRRLRIPLSAGYPYSPTLESPRSASTLRSPYSAIEWKTRYLESQSPRSATGSRHVSVRQVVTRTVTYKRTPLEPPPKGKRRKTSNEVEAEK
ncbi:hypothetical protein ASPZODRAFT_1842508 [Penicilliopsis zonata CBS 506.65]|uniref:Uncharacterized protein n=1 Tax=Penicilliopsis zonata CBS 506.65 TaxID=1073090 RepID=A0A1L9SI67_9EURO|nr:hypothetical protein ASPZODRAFT_1842508 [Penicilliopsis zonata CBS 506.65]OJJ46878.1 hypothetical protein ASPZODRAFT_1842508 [Penicilliopsis zonata CBS 506.65]